MSNLLSELLMYHIAPKRFNIPQNKQAAMRIFLNGSQILNSNRQVLLTLSSHLLKEHIKYANGNQTLLFMFTHNIFQLFVAKKGNR